MLILDFCKNVNVLNVIYYINIVLRIITIIAPIILIIMCSIDFFKVVISQNAEMKDLAKTLTRRILAAIIIFFIPTIVKAILSIANIEYVGVFACFTNATPQNIDNIAIENAESAMNAIDPSNITKAALEEFKRQINKISDESIKQKYLDKYNEYKQIYDSQESGRTSSNDTNNKPNIHIISGSGGSNNSGDNNSGNDTNTNGGTTIFIGDSRTVGLCQSVSLSADENCDIAKSSMGYSWFVDTAIPELKKKLTSSSSDTVVITMGTNDLWSSSAPSNYASAYSDLLKSYPNLNLVIVSVNPINDSLASSNGYQVTNQDVINFNTKLKAALPSGAKYCDVYSKIINDYGTSDGIHYDSSTYQKIYNAIKSCT